MKQVHLAVIVLCSLLVGPRSLAAQRHERPATFDLTGIVREEASGKPVRGVRVALDSAHLVIAYTDSSGNVTALVGFAAVHTRWLLRLSVITSSDAK